MGEMGGEGKKWNTRKGRECMNKEKKRKSKENKGKKGNEMEERERKTCITKA